MESRKSKKDEGTSLLQIKEADRSTVIPPEQQTISLQLTENNEVELPDVDTSNDEILLRIIYLGVPLTLSRAFIALGGFMQNSILAKAGEDNLAAKSLITSFEAFTISMPTSMLYVLGVEMGTAFSSLGTNNPIDIPTLVRRGFLLSCLLASPIMVFTAFGGEIFSSLSQPAEIVAISKEYFYSTIPYIPSTFILIAEQQYTTGILNSIPVGVITLTHTTLITLLTWLLVDGKAALPSLGLSGLGAALSISAFINAMGLGLYLKVRSKYQAPNFFSARPFIFCEEAKKLGKLFAFASPIGMQVGVDTIVGFLLITMIGKQGKVYLKASQIASLYNSFLNVPSFVATQCAAILISNKANNEHLNACRKISYLNMLCSGIISAISLCILYSIHESLISPFIDKNDPEKEQVSKIFPWLLLIGGLEEVVNCLKDVSIGALRGFKNTQFPMVMNIICAGVQLTLAYALNSYTNLGSEGVYLSRTVGSAVVTVPLLYRLQGYFKPQIASQDPSGPGILTQLCDSIPSMVSLRNWRNYATL